MSSPEISQRSTLLSKLWQIPLQVALYIVIFALSQQLVVQLGLPLPGNIIGLLIMILLLVSGILPISWLRAGSSWLLAEMLLFFIPAVVGVINYGPLLEQQGIKLVGVIVMSTLMVLGATAWVVEKVASWELTEQARRVSKPGE